MATIPEKNIQEIKHLYESGNTAKQIGVKLHYPLNAVYYTMRRYKIARRGGRASAALRFAQKELSFCIPKVLTDTQERLRLLGVTLYWAEGYKTEKSKGIDFANSDPAMVTVFLRFLHEVCHIDETRIKVLLYSHDKQKIPDQLHYWSTLLNIPPENFSKPYIAVTHKKLEKNHKMPYGLVHLRYSDKKLLLLVLDWINELKKT
jgi:hypothetical protein